MARWSKIHWSNFGHILLIDRNIWMIENTEKGYSNGEMVENMKEFG